MSSHTKRLNFENWVVRATNFIVHGVLHSETEIPKFSSLRNGLANDSDLFEPLSWYTCKLPFLFLFHSI